MSPPRIDLDYVAQARPARWPGVALLAVALAVAMSLAVQLREIQAERNALTVRLELLASRYPGGPPGGGRPEKEEQVAESVLRQLALPWPQMIETIETTASSEVVLLQLQPEPERRVVRLTAEAGTPEAMFDYIHRLGESKLLDGAHLVSHQVRLEDAPHPVQFVAQASLRIPR